jgi:hypothetical protein
MIRKIVVNIAIRIDIGTPRDATKRSGGFPPAERLRHAGRLNNFDLNKGRLETAPPSVARMHDA